MELNRNPEIYFSQIEQAAFAPSNFVPGIAASPDKMLQARISSCNAPSVPVYAPNSLGGPAAVEPLNSTGGWETTVS